MSESFALVFTDLVDSTRLQQTLGDEVMNRVWVQHDQAARDLIRSWRGREIGRSDGFLVLFATADDAVGFALAYQAALGQLEVPLQARAGVHYGPVELRRNSDEDVANGATPFEVDGLALPVAARVMGVAGAGQVLVTDSVLALLSGAMHRRMSQGHWRFKGVAEPMALWQVGTSATEFLPSPDDSKAYRVVQADGHWRPVRDIPSNVPAERDAFVGRRQALQALAQRFEEGARLVTLLGMGGIGKTRLALKYARDWLGEYPGGTWFCDLSAARSLDDVVDAVACGLGVPLLAHEPIRQMSRAIAGRGRCLVMLDNFEQVASHAEATIGTWLSEAPQACFLVTSRDLLGISGEVREPVAPLDSQEAVALLVERARAAKGSVDVDEAGVSAWAHLAQLLDGLPLAIELAAARVPAMSVKALTSAMTQRFRVLAGRATRGRHATLIGTLDWSWDLLSDVERDCAGQLSVFVGSFSMEAAEQVLDLSRHRDPPLVLDIVQALIDRSLLRVLPGERYGMLPTVLEYAAERLERTEAPQGSGSARHLAELRHGEFFAGFDERRCTAAGGVDADNLVAACRRAIARQDAATASATLVGSWTVLRLRGPFRMALDLADAVKRSCSDGAHSAMAHWVAGSALRLLREGSKALLEIRMGLEQASATGHRQAEALLLTELGDELAARGENAAAREALDRALMLSQSMQDDLLKCRALNSLGALSFATSRLVEARATYDSALEVAAGLGHTRWMGGIHGNLGALDLSMGDRARARQHLERALTLAMQEGDKRWEGAARCNLGLVLHEEGADEQAVPMLVAALELARQTGHRQLEWTVTCNLGLVEDALGHDEQAIQLHRRSVLLAEAIEDDRSLMLARTYLGWQLLRGGRSEEGHRELGRAAALLDRHEDVYALCLLQCARCEGALLAGDTEAARESLAAAARAAASSGLGETSEIGKAIARLRRLSSPC